MPLGQQRLHRNHSVLEDELAQYCLDLRDLIGLGVHRLLGQRQAHVVGQGRQQVDPRGTLLSRSPKRFPIKRHGGFGRRGGREGVRNDTFSPLPQFRFQCVTVHAPKDRVQRRGTGRVMGKTESVSDTSAIIAPPFGDGALAPVAT